MGNKSLIADQPAIGTRGAAGAPSKRRFIWILAYSVSRARSRGKARLNEGEKEGEIAARARPGPPPPRQILNRRIEFAVINSDNYSTRARAKGENTNRHRR